jgi:biotin-dependent carboxylase-like uncharacterized protein
MTVLVVKACGPGTTIQDHGRFGWQRYGIGPAGAMDAISHTMANALAGNAAGTAAVELAVAGARFDVQQGPIRLALAGAAADLVIGGRRVPALTSASAGDGETIEIGPARKGMFSYLAVAGGIETPPQLGSRSMHMRAALGGVPLSTGGRIAVATAVPGAERAAHQAFDQGQGPIRVILGPQSDYFTDGAIKTLREATYLVTPQADRMGIRLSGPKLEHSALGYNIVSDGIATGSIQVPGAGEPLILLADRQTTGGYPKIATVISADLPRLAQSPPGTGLRFAIVTVTEAVDILRRQTAALAAWIASIGEAGTADLTSERLLSLNLIDGWRSAHDRDPG